MGLRSPIPATPSDLLQTVGIGVSKEQVDPGVSINERQLPADTAGGACDENGLEG